MADEDLLEIDEQETEEDTVENDVETAEEEDASPAEADEDSVEESEEDESEDDLAFTFEDVEPEPQEDNESFRALRQSERDKTKRIKELEEQLKGYESPEMEVGPKPTLKDFEYDEAKYEKALTEWTERDRAAKSAQQDREREQAKEQEDYAKKLDGYYARKAALNLKDFDDVQASVEASLSKAQQSIAVKLAEDPAVLVYAIGKNPKVMDELAQITDPVEFSYKLAKLESKMRSSKNTRPAPEKKVKGTVAQPQTSDKTLAKLEAEAAKTGDRRKVIAHKKAMRAAK